MGRFSGKSSKAAQEKRDLVKVNLYEIPEYALELIANICSKTGDEDDSVIASDCYAAFFRKNNSNGLDFGDFCNKHRYDLNDLDLLLNIWEYVGELITELQAHENTNHTQIAVAGAHSSGKSTFLNTLMGGGVDLLPTGSNPVSKVLTYVYFSKDTKEVEVKGVNLKRAVVRLDPEVLQCIQHEAKIDTRIDAVLEKLFVEVPSVDLDGFAFIDTPGYTKSDKKNESNNRTDEETALEGINAGNVLLWVVDAGNGTVSKRDQGIIGKYLQGGGQRRVVIVFNKADKKGVSETTKIVQAAYRELSSRYGSSLIDIFGFSSAEDRVYYSINGYDIPSLLKQLRQSGTGESRARLIPSKIFNLFQEEIDSAQDRIDELKDRKKNIIEWKNEDYRKYHNFRGIAKEISDDLRRIAIDEYGELVRILKNSRALFEFTERGDRIGQIEEAQELFMDPYIRNLKDNYEYWDNQEQSINKEIRYYESLRRQLIEYQDIFRSTLGYAIQKFRDSHYKPQDIRIQIPQGDVFSAIASGDMRQFMACFARGVKMSLRNESGYSPLTYAVHKGANDMVQFFINQGVELGEKDSRGMDALLTAVEDGYKDIISMLLEHDPDLKKTQSEAGETPQEIALKHPFAQWLQGQLS